MVELLDQIAGIALYAAGSIVGLVLAYVTAKYVVPWLKEKRLYKLIENLIPATEKEFKQPGDGPFKKEWILQQLEQILGKNYNRDLAEKFVDGLVMKLTAKGVINVDYFLVDKEFAKAVGGETTKQNEAK